MCQTGENEERIDDNDNATSNIFMKITRFNQIQYHRKK